MYEQCALLITFQKKKETPKTKNPTQTSNTLSAGLLRSVLDLTKVHFVYAGKGAPAVRAEAERWPEAEHG